MSCRVMWCDVMWGCDVHYREPMSQQNPALLRTTKYCSGTSARNRLVVQNALELRHSCLMVVARKTYTSSTLRGATCGMQGLMYLVRQTLTNRHCNVTKFFTCHEKWDCNFTKYCACRAKLQSTTNYCPCNKKVTLQPHQVLRLPRNWCAKMWQKRQVTLQHHANFTKYCTLTTKSDSPTSMRSSLTGLFLDRTIPYLDGNTPLRTYPLTHCIIPSAVPLTELFLDWTILWQNYIDLFHEWTISLGLKTS